MENCFQRALLVSIWSGYTEMGRDPDSWLCKPGCTYYRSTSRSTSIAEHFEAFNVGSG